MGSIVDHRRRELSEIIGGIGMIGICSKCGNHDWDKEVEGDRIRCPKCGHTWEFVSLPLLILTGCSGVGKTTTAMEIMRRKPEFVVLDADIFYGVMSLETEEDHKKWVESIGNLSKNIMQSGHPVLWTMAGNLDKLSETYSSRFFSEIRCLALVCEEELLRARMREGRGITDEGWIQGSVEYNQYFKTHDTLGDTKFDVLDISGRSVSEVADTVISWVEGSKTGSH